MVPRKKFAHPPLVNSQQNEIGKWHASHIHTAATWEGSCERITRKSKQHLLLIAIASETPNFLDMLLGKWRKRIKSMWPLHITATLCCLRNRHCYRASHLFSCSSFQIRQWARGSWGMVEVPCVRKVGVAFQLNKVFNKAVANSFLEHIFSSKLPQFPFHQNVAGALSLLAC